MRAKEGQLNKSETRMEKKEPLEKKFVIKVRRKCLNGKSQKNGREKTKGDGK